MQILIISLPSGEQVSSLSYTLNAGETLIGQGSYCQIQLPDQQGLVAERHARITREDDLWYLENLTNHSFTVNTTDIQKGFQQRYLLSDGDVMICGDYCLMVSDFSPWKNPPSIELEAPSLNDLTDHAPEYCVIPSSTDSSAKEYLDDPFSPPDHLNARNDMSMSVDVTMKSQPEVNTNPLLTSSQGTLIDVLAEDCNEEDDDWSINRNLWNNIPKSEDSSSVPVLSELVRLQPTTKQNNHHSRSVCQAMLWSLEQFIQDLSPEKLSSQFGDSHSISASDCWSEYQKYYRKMINDQSYRLLFLHRFRQALKQQEQH